MNDYESLRLQLRVALAGFTADEDDRDATFRAGQIMSLAARTVVARAHEKPGRGKTLYHQFRRHCRSLAVHLPRAMDVFAKEGNRKPLVTIVERILEGGGCTTDEEFS